MIHNAMWTTVKSEMDFHCEHSCLCENREDTVSWTLCEWTRGCLLTCPESCRDVGKAKFTLHTFQSRQIAVLFTLHNLLVFKSLQFSHYMTERWQGVTHYKTFHQVEFPMSRGDRGVSEKSRGDVIYIVHFLFELAGHVACLYEQHCEFYNQKTYSQVK